MQNTTAATSGANVEHASSSATHNITSFEDDTIGATSSEPIPSPVPLVPFMDVEGSGTIIDFLERPTLLSQGAFTTTDITTLYSVDPFLALVTGAKAPKLNGIYGVKADLEITLNVNATRFQSGRYILAFLPSGGIPISAPAFATYRRMHATTLVNITQLPHVEIDIASQTHVTLSLPWKGVAPFFVNLSTYPVGFGQLFLYPYVGLQSSSGDSVAGYTIWASMKNVSLIGPTVTQSALGDAEAKRKGKGPVETVLSKVALASNILGDLPLLGNSVKGVGWSASLLARAAHAFGWSKPLDMSAPMVTRGHQIKFLENVDGISTAKQIGAVSTNAVDPVPMNVHSAVDEMSYDFVKQVYAYFQTVPWTASYAAGTQLASFSVTPNEFNAYGSGYVMPPVCFLANTHQYWRGSLKYRFKFVKNEFYSGRLMFSYEPNYKATNISTTIAQTEFDRRIVVDVRQTNEVELTVPFISPFMFQEGTTGIGHLIITVIDPLVAPSTVPSTISIVTEICGGPDFEVAAPLGCVFEPWAPFVTQSALSSSVKADLGSPSDKASLLPATMCIGEKMMSFRQLWKLPVELIGDNTFNRTIAASANKAQIVGPFYVSVVVQNTSITATLVRSYFFGDFYDLVSSMYTCVTGSARVVITDPGRYLWALGYSFGTIQRGLVNSDHHTANENDNLKTYVDLTVEPLDVTIPPYQKTMGRSVSGSMFNDAGTGGFYPVADFTSTTNLVAVPYTTTAITVRRMPADDANAWGFIGVPALVYKTQT